MSAEHAGAKGFRLIPAILLVTVPNALIIWLAVQAGWTH